MIEEYGVVERVSDDGTVVRITAPAACDRCTIRESCHAAGKSVTVPEIYELQPAQPVRLRISNASILGVTLITYGIPFVTLIGGLFGAYFALFAGYGEDARILLSVVVGVAALLLSGFAVARIDRSMVRRFRYTLEPVAEIPQF